MKGYRALLAAAALLCMALLCADGSSGTPVKEVYTCYGDEILLQYDGEATQIHWKVTDEEVKTYGVRYFSELTNMAVLTEEVGELARVMARKYGDQSFKPGEKENLGEEMADVLWVLICLANQTGVDLTEELKKSIEKKTKRDAERHINNEKLK